MGAGLAIEVGGALCRWEIEEMVLWCGGRGYFFSYRNKEEGGRSGGFLGRKKEKKDNIL